MGEPRLPAARESAPEAAAVAAAVLELVEAGQIPRHGLVARYLEALPCLGWHLTQLRIERQFQELRTAGLSAGEAEAAVARAVHLSPRQVRRRLRGV